MGLYKCRPRDWAHVCALRIHCVEGRICESRDLVRRTALAGGRRARVRFDGSGPTWALYARACGPRPGVHVSAPHFHSGRGLIARPVVTLYEWRAWRVRRAGGRRRTGMRLNGLRPDRCDVASMGRARTKGPAREGDASILSAAAAR